MTDETTTNTDEAFRATIREARGHPVDNSDATLIKNALRIAGGRERDVIVLLNPPLSHRLSTSDPFDTFTYHVTVRVRWLRDPETGRCDWVGEITSRPRNLPAEWELSA